MKQLIHIIVICCCSISSAFATEQIPDRLIIGDDTVYIKSFPLDELRFQNSPFKYGDGTYSSPHTACWRGYVATWKVIDDRLMLIEVEKVDSTAEKLDILEYFALNDYSPDVINGNVFANWHNANYVVYPDAFNHKYSRLYLWSYAMPNDELPRIVFKNGILTKNIIRSMDSFQIGDTITKQVPYYRHWLLSDGVAEVRATIAEKNRNLVRIDVLTWGTDSRRQVEKVKKIILGWRDENYWVNPRYWK